MDTSEFVTKKDLEIAFSDFRKDFRAEIREDMQMIIGTLVENFKSDVELLSEQLLSTRQTMEVRFDKLERSNAILVEEVGNIKVEIAEIKEDIVEMKADIVEIKEDIVEMKADIAGMKDEIVEIKEEISSMNNKLDLKVDRSEVSHVLRTHIS